MREVILLKYGEMALKGLNKNSFENVIYKNIKKKLHSLGEYNISKAQSVIYISSDDVNFDMEECKDRLACLFGIASISTGIQLEKDYDIIAKEGFEYIKETLENADTFKVTAKRADKNFPMSSPEICREFGGYIYEKIDGLEVDVHSPDITVTVDVRDRYAYVYADKIQGAGGMPVGSSGSAMLLISGGIDSPVAGYMMAKRGLQIHSVHFQSPPYTSDRALDKVVRLQEKMCRYCDTIRMSIINFTEIQEAIRDNCMEDYLTIIMRRIMMRIAQICAKDSGCEALITGESLAQVASQTMKALAATDAVCDMPVFRPAIGMDKVEIIEISKKIDTFDISIEPFEDCCTVFTPRHPKTKPEIELVLAEEAKLDIEGLIERAMDTREIKYIHI